MSSPEDIEGINSSEESVADLPLSVVERQLMDRLQSEFVRDERRNRRATFRVAKQAIKYAWDLSLHLNGKPGSYHRTYANTPQDEMVERSVVFRVFNFPGMGNLARVIVNDRGPHPSDIDGRQLTIQDYVIALASNTFTWQETCVLRGHQEKGWARSSRTGPIIEPRINEVEIVSGDKYNTNLPRVGGYRTPLNASIINRLQLEHVATIVASLDVSSYQPGFSLPESF